MNDWQKIRLGDISEMCLGKMLDKEKNKGEFQPYLANINVRWGDFNLTDLSRMRFQESENDRYGLKYGDIVICEGGEPGRCAVWKEKLPNMKFQKALHRVRIKGDFSNQFVYYRFLLAGRNGELRNYFIGSTIKHLTGVALKEIEFSYPSFNEQKKIASVLSALDSKIELNNRINAELEAMAKTLYDYWFVQFDFPDERGKPYKSSGGKMQYNAELKRKIPDGWEVENLIDVSSLLVRGVSPKYIESDGISVLNQKCIRNKTISFSFGRRHDALSKNAESKLIQIGDVLVNSTGTGTLGRVALVKWLEESLTTVDSHITIVRIDKDKANPYFIGYSLTEKQSEIEQLGEGSTGQTELSRDNLGKLKLIIPLESLQKTFEKFIQPQFKKIAINERENQQLAELRDWLLPMLMNGQVMVN